MRLPSTAHTSRPWRIHELTRDFRLEDVWALATRGGSFGFRGHRYELIEPDLDKGRTFLRVALGWRGGWSCQGLCELFAALSHRGFD